MSRVWIVSVTLLASVAFGGEPKEVVDEFDGKFDLEWEIQNPVEHGLSLEENPGELTIYTLQGSIWNSNSGGVKNLMLLKEPIDPDVDFECVLHVTTFDPTQLYHQVGLIFYESDDQYLKLTYEADTRKTPPTIVAINNEEDGKAKNPGPVLEEFDGPFWLRMRRREGLYMMDYSDDGDRFWMVADQEWSPTDEDKPVRIGIVAKKGPGSRSKDIPATIESFQLKIAEP